MTGSSPQETPVGPVAPASGAASAPSEAIVEMPAGPGARARQPRSGRSRFPVGLLFRPGSVTHLVMGAVLVAGALWALTGSPFIVLVGQSCVIFAVASVGQSVLISSAGQIALSGAAFMAIGAFGTG